MYVPQHFAENDPTTLAAFIDAHSFGTLVTSVDGVPFASHVPFIYDRAAGLLHCHLARANPQWRHFESSAEALAIFAGPHSYVSPTWYTDAGVPTWNYAVAHVYGSGRIVDDADATGRHVEALAAKFEQGRASPWVPNYDRRRLAGIVGVELRVRAIEGKFKLSQNRSAADRAGVVTQLRASGTDNDAALAALMVAASESAPGG
ncbi:MAG: FMN-binding negative transcriptional regulator [Gammaproteobacteria bacterium]